MSPEQLAAFLAECERETQRHAAVVARKAQVLVAVNGGRPVRVSRQFFRATPRRQPSAPSIIVGRDCDRAPRSRRTVRSRSTRGPPGSTEGEPEPPLARLPRACVIFARAAAIERLAASYALAGRLDLFAIGVDIAERIEDWADMKAAA